MSSITSSVNALLATNFAPVQRTNAPGSNASNHSFTRELLGSDLKPGTTVTAQTQYTVGLNGRLQRTGSQVLVGDQPNPASLPALPYATPARPQTFGDLNKPKPQLTPSEEAVIFAADSIEGDTGEQAPQRYTDSEGAIDEQGETIEVEILSPELADQQPVSVSSKLQANVSSLYARNNDIVYHTEPMFALAA